MTLDEQVRRMLFLYPGVSPSPLDVLIHHFAGCGTGAEWNDEGELVFAPCCAKKKLGPQRVEFVEELMLLRLHSEQMRKPYLTKEVFFGSDEITKELNGGLLEAYDQQQKLEGLSVYQKIRAKELAEPRWVAETCPLFDFPQNVKMEYLEAMLTVASVLLKTWNLTPEIRTKLQKMIPVYLTTLDGMYNERYSRPVI